MKNNSSLWAWIGRDGDQRWKPLLSTGDKLFREVIIEGHFRKFYKSRYGVDLPDKHVERDNPNDFVFASASGEKYYMEIVSLRESGTSHQKQAAQRILETMLENEPHLVIAILYDTLSTKALKGLVDEMNTVSPIHPTPELLDELFAESRAKSHSIVRRIKVTNGKRMFITDGENISIAEAVLHAVTLKEAKSYEHVNDMILIIDDQSIEYSAEMIMQSQGELVTKLQASQFKEIFVYSGAYSAEDGTDAAFSIFPYKCEHDMELLAFLQANKPS